MIAVAAATIATILFIIAAVVELGNPTLFKMNEKQQIISGIIFAGIGLISLWIAVLI